MERAKHCSFDAWRALVAAHAAVKQRVNHIFSEHGLTGAQFGVVRVVGDAGPEGTKLGEIGERLFVTCGNITGLVDRLQERGLLAREAHPSDRRVLLARLTPTGQELYDEIVPAHRAAIAEAMAVLSEEQQVALTGLLTALQADQNLCPPQSSETT